MQDVIFSNFLRASRKISKQRKVQKVYPIFILYEERLAIFILF
jgi:hypothetical protein